MTYHDMTFRLSQPGQSRRGLLHILDTSGQHTSCSDTLHLSGVLQSEHATIIQPYSGLIEGASIALVLEPVEFTNHQEV